MRWAACLLALVIVAVSARPATSAVYRWVDDRGVVHYSDRPPGNVERTESAAPPPSTIPDVPSPSSTRDVPTPTHEAPSRADAAAPADAPPAAERPAPAPRASAPRSQPIRELMDRMHVASEADHMARRAWQVMLEQRFRARNVVATSTAVNAAFTSGALAATAGAHLTQALGDSPMLPEILAWLRSPLGQRVMDLAAQPDTPARAAAFRRFAAGLPDDVSIDRIRLVREFGRTSDFFPLFKDTMTAIDVAVIDLIERPGNGHAPPSSRDRTDRWSSDLVRWQGQLTLLFDFRELSDAQMREAIAFWTSPPGRTLSRAYRDALLAAIATAHDRAAGVSRNPRSLVSVH